MLIIVDDDCSKQCSGAGNPEVSGDCCGIALISLVSYTPYSGTPQLNRLRQVITMLITHDLRMAAYCQRRIGLHDGKIVSGGMA